MPDMFSCTVNFLGALEQCCHDVCLDSTNDSVAIGAEWPNESQYLSNCLMTATAAVVNC